MLRVRVKVWVGAGLSMGGRGRNNWLLIEKKKIQKTNILFYTYLVSKNVNSYLNAVTWIDRKRSVK